MGLDSYLSKKIDVNVYDFNQKGDCEGKKLTIKTVVEWKDGKTEEREYTCKPQHDGYVYLPVAYWRKVNEIHRWFVDLNDGVDDCKPITVYGDKILELVDLCKQVLADHSKAKKLLPTQSGFFFGGTEYDEWYFKDLEQTIKMLEDTKPEDTFVYEASW